MSSVLDPAVRAALTATQLKALLSDHAAVPSSAPTAMGTGSAVIDDQGTAWVLAGDRPERSLGPALAYAVRRQATSVHLIATSGTALLARRAAGLTMPVRVSHLEGRTLIDAVAEPLPDPIGIDVDHQPFVAQIVAGGAIPVGEHGVLAGEVAGLEVCRVVDDLHSAEVRLEVGVGAHDRETFQLLHGDRPTVEALSDVVRFVTRHRTGEAPHPLQQLGASRFLRDRLVNQPELIGLSELVLVPPPLPRANLKDEVPCVAYSESADTLVVCIHGVDLDAVPYACDALTAHSATACIIAAPQRDVIDIQQRLAQLVRIPTRFVGVPPVEPR
jgi:hypothetical protein